MTISPFSKGRPFVWRETDGLACLPKEWGAYRFVRISPVGEDETESNSNGRVDYVGITSNVYMRIAKHRSTRKIYDATRHVVHYQIANDGATWEQLCRWEVEKIAAHKPALVKTKGGNGKPPALTIAGLEVEPSGNESVEDAVVRLGLLDRFIALMPWR